MPNTYITQRLRGIHNILNCAYAAGAGLSSATKGAERQAFVHHFLSVILPSPFRFGTGDITDSLENRSGEIDIVIEYPFLPSFPTVPGSEPRLYLAESVAATIEVKSDISSQWDEAVRTANRLHDVYRMYSYASGENPGEKIPLFVVGYKGWKDIETLNSHLAEVADLISGILVLDPGCFVSNERFGSTCVGNEWSLWGLVCCLNKAVNMLVGCNEDLTMYYENPRPLAAP